MSKVLLITLQGCSHCENVKKTLARLKSDYPNLHVEELDVHSAKGQELVKKHSITSAPAIFIDNQFIQQGEMSEDEFRKRLNK
jgi:glutaredoxin